MQTNNNSIVLSCRVELLRNLASSPFPHKLGVLAANNLFCRVANAAAEELGGKVYKMSDLDESDIAIMMQKKLVSQKLVNNADFSGVVVSRDETVSIMINEEDHIKECCTFENDLLEEAYKTIDTIDTKLDAKLGFAFDPKFGFLTTKLLNVGDAMRAHVFMFLPALSIDGKIAGVAETVKNMGIDICGTDEGSALGGGYVFDVSNARCIGKTERDILQTVDAVSKRIAKMEKEERKILAANPGVQLKDMIFRAYSVLCGAFALEFDEFVQMLSQVKLGAILGLLRFKDDKLFDKLFVSCSRAGLERICGHTLIGDNENIYRADYVSRMIKQNSI